MSRKQSLGQRLQRLVEAVHDGNMNAAAKDIGVAQPTIRRIIDGEVEHPRSDVLQAIAGFYNVSIDWLVTDVGDEPAILNPSIGYALPERLRWSATVARLGLTPRAHFALLAQPDEMLVWALDAGVTNAAMPAGVDMAEIQRSAHRTWIANVATLEAAIGTKATRDLFERQANELALNLRHVRAEVLSGMDLSNDVIADAIEQSNRQAGFGDELSAARAGRPKKRR